MSSIKPTKSGINLESFLGENIAAARKAVRKTQAEIAEALGEQLRTIQSWEQGERKPPLDKFCQLAEALGTEPNILLGFVTPELDKEALSAAVDKLNAAQQLIGSARQAVDKALGATPGTARQLRSPEAVLLDVARVIRAGERTSKDSEENERSRSVNLGSKDSHPDPSIKVPKRQE